MEEAIEYLKAEKTVFQPEDLLEKLGDADSWKDKPGVTANTIAGAKSAQKYIKQNSQNEGFHRWINKHR